ncbi:putative Glutathione synthetase [Paratrimastix pyriformis]|uniref:Glutathione synthetase n=1 Tax=Paratrimastix pyriformis TaxID=342808 RepID=A0ABQ8URH2_9EUKA|nr:putative Glutathione synthetase [Paratrimastix pyriformis]
MAETQNIFPEILRNQTFFYGKDFSGVINVPFALRPMPFPRNHFDHAVSLAPLFNTLIMRICDDPQWLIQALDQVAKIDDFVGHLLDLYRTVLSEGVEPRLVGVFRSDYMLTPLHPRDPQQRLPVGEEEMVMRQVEINTISSSFISHGTSVFNLHHRRNPAVPANEALPKVAAALVQAHQAFCQALDPADGRVEPVFVLVGQPGERNLFDQRLLLDRIEAAVRPPPTASPPTHATPQPPPRTRSHARFLPLCGGGQGVRTMILTMEQVATRGSLDAHKRLILSDPTRPATAAPLAVSVCYLRCGYTPKDYISPKVGTPILTRPRHTLMGTRLPARSQCWEARLLMERSRAWKCPTLGAQLAGCKRIQELLAQPGVVERFMGSDPAGCAALRSVFAAFYPLEKETYSSTLAMVRAQPLRYVLKPQREGGGNNFYGPVMVDLLTRCTTDPARVSEACPHLHSFTLMERLWPPRVPTILARDFRFFDDVQPQPQPQSQPQPQPQSQPQPPSVSCPLVIEVPRGPARALLNNTEHSGHWEQGVYEQTDAVAELGIFSTLIVSPSTGVLNSCEAGYLLRSKGAQFDDGGVAAGVAFLDAPELTA